MRTTLPQLRRLFLAAIFLPPLLLSSAYAQSAHDPLTDKETDEVREVADQPPARVKLYVKYIEDRISAIDGLQKNTKAVNRSAQIHNRLEEFTRLVDELQDNLDEYDSYASNPVRKLPDLRKNLKELVPESSQWLDALRALPPDPQYDFVKQTSIEAGTSLYEASKTSLESQNTYFAEQKKKSH